MGYDDSMLLFARPSFIRGLGRAIDLGATRNSYNAPAAPSEADSAALASDWAAVGKDVRGALLAYSGGARHGR